LGRTAADEEVRVQLVVPAPQLARKVEQNDCDVGRMGVFDLVVQRAIGAYCAAAAVVAAKNERYHHCLKVPVAVAIWEIVEVIEAEIELER
jgi:hypothetical protein